MGKKTISPAVLDRLPTYLAYLKTLPPGTRYISATGIAKALAMGEVSVRKDLSAICDIGRPKVGYSVSELAEIIEAFLGYDRTDTAIIVGAGKLGRALLDYEGFRAYGISLAAAFDNDPALWGKTESGKPILDVEKLPVFCKENNVHVGIIAVPASAAQDICSKMAACGIRAIMNFAPTHLLSPPGVTVRNENIATSLAQLCKSAAEI